MAITSAKWNQDPFTHKELVEDQESKNKEARWETQHTFVQYNRISKRDRRIPFPLDQHLHPKYNKDNIHGWLIDGHWSARWTKEVFLHSPRTADEIVICGDLQQQNPTMAVILNDWVWSMNQFMLFLKPRFRIVSILTWLVLDFANLFWFKELEWYGSSKNNSRQNTSNQVQNPAKKRASWKKEFLHCCFAIT